MKTIHATPIPPVNTKSEATPEVAPSARRQPPLPGRIVSFEEAMEITLREDKELLRRLAQ